MTDDITLTPADIEQFAGAIATAQATMAVMAGRITTLSALRDALNEAITVKDARLAQFEKLVDTLRVSLLGIRSHLESCDFDDALGQLDQVLEAIDPALSGAPARNC